MTQSISSLLYALSKFSATRNNGLGSCDHNDFGRDLDQVFDPVFFAERDLWGTEIGQIGTQNLHNKVDVRDLTVMKSGSIT